MIDYNFVVMSRTEYQERVAKIEAELAVRQTADRTPGAFGRMLYSLGEWLENAGARLKAQHQPIAMQQHYNGGHAG